MEECAENLARLAESDSDQLIPCLIQLQRLAEEINLAFNYDVQILLPQMDAVRIEILIKSFEQRLNQLEKTFPPTAWNNSEYILTLQSLENCAH